MPTTARGIEYPSSTGHTRLWEHLETLADTTDTAIDDAIAIRTWTTYTPTWTAASSNPSLGNGVLQGRYRYLDDDTVLVFILLRPGSTTTFGSGAYQFNLPVEAPAGGPDVMLYGAAQMGGPAYPLVGRANTASSSASFVTVLRANVTSQENYASWTGTAPATFANGHSFSMGGIYRVAW